MASPHQTVSDLGRRYSRLLGARDAVSLRLSSCEEEIKKLENEQDLLLMVQETIRSLIDREVEQGVSDVRALLSEGLKAIFHDQDLSVETDVSVQRGKVSVDLMVVHKRPDGTEIRGLPTDSFGGAVATVISVLLRIWVMKKRGLRPFMCLDETLPAFDGNYVQNMGEFLRLVCDRLGVDLLLVTHNPSLVEAADVAYQIVPTDNGAKFKRVT